MEDSVTAGPRLLLFSTLPARSPVVAHVVAAVVEAIAPRESAIGAPVLADSVLQSWNRTPAAPVSAATRPATADAGASLARLLWCAVLLLLAAEWFVRRRISVAIVGLGGRDAER
jgi:predicted small integral membrane protein